MKMTNFVERLKMLPMAQKENKSYYKQEPCYICKQKFYSDIKIYRKVWDYEQYTWVSDVWYAI